MDPGRELVYDEIVALLRESLCKAFGFNHEIQGSSSKYKLTRSFAVGLSRLRLKMSRVLVSRALLCVLALVLPLLVYKYANRSHLQAGSLSSADVLSESLPESHGHLLRHLSNLITQDASVRATCTGTATVVNDTNGGAVSVEYWEDLEGFLVDHLRMNPRFPDHPTLRKVQSSLECFSLAHNMAVKMHGFLSPSATGQYRFGLVSSNASELWISSDHQPQNLRKVACVACIDQQNLPARVHPPKPKTFTTDADASLALLPNVELSEGKMYYFEVYLKTGSAGQGSVSTKWKTPNTNEWKAIPATAFGALDGEQSKTSSSSPLPSHRPQHPLRVYYSGDELVDSVVLKEVLPECDYRPKYAYEHHVPKYEGRRELVNSAVYPDDHTDLTSWRLWSYGNPQISQKRVQTVVDLYTAALKQSSYGSRFDHIKVILLEETANNLRGDRDGWRYLLEAEIYWKDTDKPTYISEYLYRSEKDPAKKLCSVRGHQWNRTAKVHMLLPVKNQGKWVVHSLRNLEDIYLTTGDTNFVLTFIDFESTDINMAEVLENTRLPKDMIKLINLKGEFSRTSSLQAGIDSPDVKTNDIILTADLHLTFPSGYIQTARKHTIQGRMGYAPTFVRLDQGLTEYDINGFWEQMGFGQIAMCKSDFMKIGGMNTEEFKFEWGGEDWEVTDRIRSNGYELFRLRYPSFVHYFHSRAGMWSN